MLPRERHDWYCSHCHSGKKYSLDINSQLLQHQLSLSGGEVLLCGGCHRVYHDSCLKSEAQSVIKSEHGGEEEDEEEMDLEWTCTHCKVGSEYG